MPEQKQKRKKNPKRANNCMNYEDVEKECAEYLWKVFLTIDVLHSLIHVIKT